jgi:hypothetical protein
MPLLSEEQTANLAGDFLDDSYIHHLIEEDTDAFKEDGSPLVMFRKRQVPERHAGVALKALYHAATEYGNRGVAAGKLKYHAYGKNSKESRGKKLVNVGDDDIRAFYMKEDGTISKTVTAMTVPSGIIGAYDRHVRFPYCRLTKFTMEHPEKIIQALPFIQSVNEVFKRNLPDRYGIQLGYCQKTHSNYVFPNTAFTTVTVNRNWRTAVHTDAQDLKAGFGVLSVLTEGRYKGGIYTLPRYGVGVNMQQGDVLLTDVHEYHGNTEIVPTTKYWTRLSFVFYYRTRVLGCKSLEEEREIAKRRKEGTSLYPDFGGVFPA